MSRAFIGCGAGFAGDRTDAAGPVVRALAERDGPRYLIFETLAERTLALAQVERRSNRGPGYSPALERFVSPVLRDCVAAGIRIVSNFGAANPRAAAERIAGLAQELGCPSIRVAIVDGDELTARLTPAEFAERETGGRILAAHPPIVVANAYMGAEPIAQALREGADVVVTGRVADPALVLGPLLHTFDWRLDDLDRIAAGTLAGHLLECGSQITGGYFADPGFKDVPGMDDLGYPIAEVEESGAFVITKPDGTGGLVDRRTVTEQILYEIHDPAAYLTPDVVLDITQVEIEPSRRKPDSGERREGQAETADAQGDGLHRWRLSRGGGNLLCWSECGGACQARHRDDQGADGTTRTRRSHPRRCHRRDERPCRSRRNRRRGSLGASPAGHPRALCRPVRRCGQRRDPARRGRGALLRGSRRRRRAPASLHAAPHQRVLPD